MTARRVLIALLLLLSAGSARAQVGVRYDNIALSSSGRPIGGASIAVCTTGLATTGAQIVGGSVATLTFGTSPIAAGFVQGKSLTVAGFTGTDAFLNGSYTIASVTSSTISYALSHSNYTASSNGTAFQTGDVSTSCAPLATVYSDSGLSAPIAQPGIVSDGLSNYGFWGAAGAYKVQIYGSVVATKVMDVTLPVPAGGTIANATNLVGPGNITGTFGGSPTLSVPLTSSVSTGTAPFSIASTTVVPNLNAQLHGGLTAPASAILGLTDAQAPTNKTFDISANTLKTSTNTAGHVPRNNGTNYVDAQLACGDLSNATAGCSTALQGTDTKLLTSGTVSGTGAGLCTDANGGATTSGCASSGGAATGCTNNTPVTVSNTTSATNLLSCSIAANALSAGSVLHVSISGVESTAAAYTPNITLNLGGGTSCLTATGTTAGGNNQPWNINAVFVVITAGSSGTGNWSCEYFSSPSGGGVSGPNGVVGAPTISINTTVSNTLLATVSMSVANTGDSVTAQVLKAVIF